MTLDASEVLAVYLGASTTGGYSLWTARSG
jgi:hypothetical protein